MNRMSQWMAVIFSTWLTWACYMTGTHHASEALVDAIPWIVWFLFLVSLTALRMEDDFLVQIQAKTHILKAAADVNTLVQVFLLVVTGRWILAAVLAAAQLIVRGKVNGAIQRTEEAQISQGAT